MSISMSLSMPVSMSKSTSIVNSVIRDLLLRRRSQGLGGGRNRVRARERHSQTGYGTCPPRQQEIGGSAKKRPSAAKAPGIGVRIHERVGRQSSGGSSRRRAVGDKSSALLESRFERAMGSNSGSRCFSSVPRGKAEAGLAAARIAGATPRLPGFEGRPPAPASCAGRSLAVVPGRPPSLFPRSGIRVDVRGPPYRHAPRRDPRSTGSP